MLFVFVQMFFPLTVNYSFSLLSQFTILWTLEEGRSGWWKQRVFYKVKKWEFFCDIFNSSIGCAASLCCTNWYSISVGRSAESGLLTHDFLGFLWIYYNILLMEVVLIDVSKAVHVDPITNRACCANTSVFAQALLTQTVRPVCEVSLMGSGTRKYCMWQETAHSNSHLVQPYQGMSPLGRGIPLVKRAMELWIKH